MTTRRMLNQQLHLTLPHALRRASRKRPLATLAHALALGLMLACARLAPASADVPAAAPSAAPTNAAADFIKPDTSASCSAPLRALLATIRADDLRIDLDFLASPALEGRGLSSVGLDAACEYVVATFRRAGLRGGAAPGPASFEQRVPLCRIARPGGGLEVQLHGATVSFVGGRDCLLPEAAPQMVAAPVVFAKYGIAEPTLGRDDLKGLDLRGKAALVLGGLPSDLRLRAPALIERYAAKDPDDRNTARLDALAKTGAAMLIVIEDDLAQTLAATKPPTSHFVSPERDVQDEAPLLVRVSPAQGRALLAAAGLDVSHVEGLAPAPLPGVTATLRLTGESVPFEGRNVIATLPGSDPAVRDEAVIIGAHVDHLGRVGAELFPGADDNASGVSALLAIARAMAASPLRPRRTLVFAAWTGEEMGHFGSRHYMRHPLWPLDKTAAYLNLDMIAHPWTEAEIRKLVIDSGLQNGEAWMQGIRPCDFVEPGVADWAAGTLVPVLASASSATGLNLHVDRTSGRHGGSDYRSFALQGVPFVRFFGSYFPDYHKPGDRSERLDARQIERMARLACATLWILANR